MATNEYINKIIVGSEAKMDLTADTIIPSDLKSGVTAHDKSGAPITGTNTFDSDTSGATAVVAEILTGKTAYARGSKLTGNMPNNGAKVLDIATLNAEPAIATGFHDGSGKARIAAAEKAKLIAANIKQGITILGVLGTYGGEPIAVEANKTVTPSFTQQIVAPSTGKDYLAQVTVAAIPVAETDNSAGGKTLTIGG